MRALTLYGSDFVLEDLPAPTPGRGQLLVRPLFNGICGSDVHMRERRRERAAAAGGGGDPALPALVLGHEFSAAVVAVGPDTATDLVPGDRIVALPFSPGAGEREAVNVGLSPDRPGALAALVLVDADRSYRIPDGVPADLAALTEPLSVGRHAANLADRNAGPNIIVGCGPIGLAVLLALKDQGRGPVVALDLSPQRRAMAATLGADTVLDPRTDNPYADWHSLAFTPEATSPLLPRELATRPRGVNIFDCTGVPAVLQQIVREAPQHSHIVYTGVCVHDVATSPIVAMLREITIEYSFAYRPVEFAESLDMIARKPDLVGRLVTGIVPLDRTEEAFDRLGGAPDEIKLLIDVRSE